MTQATMKTLIKGAMLVTYGFAPTKSSIVLLECGISKCYVKILFSVSDKNYEFFNNTISAV